MDKYLSEIESLEAEQKDLKEQYALLEPIVAEMPNRIKKAEAELQQEKDKLKIIDIAQKIKKTSYVMHILKEFKKTYYEIYKSLKCSDSSKEFIEKIIILVLSTFALCLLFSFIINSIGLHIFFSIIYMLLKIFCLFNLAAIFLFAYEKLLVDKKNIDQEIKDTNEKIRKLTKSIKHNTKLHQEVCLLQYEIMERIDELPPLIESLTEERNDAIKTFEPELNKVYEMKRTRKKEKING